MTSARREGLPSGPTAIGVSPRGISSVAVPSPGTAVPSAVAGFWAQPAMIIVSRESPRKVFSTKNISRKDWTSLDPYGAHLSPHVWRGLWKHAPHLLHRRRG